MKEIHMKLNTHIHSENSTQKMMIHYLIALLPLVVFGFFKNGVFPFFQGHANVYELLLPLLIVLISCLFTVATEVTCEWVKCRFQRKEFVLEEMLKHSYAYVSGIVFALILPIHTPIYLVILGSVLTSFLGKVVFGGFGKNFFNPAVIGGLIILFLFGSTIQENGGYINALEAAEGLTDTPFAVMMSLGNIGNYQTLVAPFGRMLNFIFGTVPGGIGMTASILCVVGFVYLTWNKVIKWRIPVCFIGSVFLLTAMIGAYHELGFWYPFYQVMTGGLLFVAVYMATDPVTTPTTPIGQVLYGIFLGILTIFFHYVMPLELGTLVSIFFMNAFVMLLDIVGSRARFRFDIAILPFCLAWTMILLLGIYIGVTYPKKTSDTGSNPTVENKEQDFKIVSQEYLNPYIMYDIEGRTSSGTYVIKVYTVGQTIQYIQILQHHETANDYQMILGSNYLGQLILNQNDLQSQPVIQGVELSVSLRNNISKLHRILENK